MIYIVRHGQTDWNVLTKRQGHTNIPLNQKGIEQAEELKEKLKDVSFDLVFSSPLDRAINTAKIITNHEIIVDDRLIERKNGKLEGLTREEIQKIQKAQDYCEEKYDVEPTKELQNRADSCLKDILQSYPHKNILIVSHGGFIINLRCFLDGIPDDINSYFLNNCDIYTYKN